MATAPGRRWFQLQVDLLRTRVQPADIAIFHEFEPPPTGGGHQFMRALSREFSARGFRLENNRISPVTRACLFNSFNFDYDRLKRFHRAGCRMVHRVDGPIEVYRGYTDGTDRRINDMNQALADVTIFQSHYSVQKHLELGMSFNAPQVIYNTPDPDIFHPVGRIGFDLTRKVRLMSTSWSNNPNKGAAVYQWLDQHLDWSRFDYTFVGRSPVTFQHIRQLPPQPSTTLADLLRQHDIYLTASRFDPCSNALLEALSSGLPALYLRSGGHAELVGQAGFGFDHPEEIPAALDRLVEEYDQRQQQITVLDLETVATQYLAALGWADGQWQ
ncbi:MAG: glycosyltransferase family 4 protein [Cyanobacteria bacterium J06633_1]